MTWDEVCADPCLQDLPYKIETNAWGEIVMSPAQNRHAVIQGEVTRQLRAQTNGGLVSVEFALQTRDGVKVPDVVWMSADFYGRHQAETCCSAAPEICVEVISPSEPAAKRRFKAALYFEQGAREVWFVSLEGKVRFLVGDAATEQPASALCPEFPALVEIVVR